MRVSGMGWKKRLAAVGVASTFAVAAAAAPAHAAYRVVGGHYYYGTATTLTSQDHVDICAGVKAGHDVEVLFSVASSTGAATAAKVTNGECTSVTLGMFNPITTVSVRAIAQSTSTGWFQTEYHVYNL